MKRIFLVTSLIALLFIACEEQSSTLEPGIWRAVLALPGGELPFSIDIREDGNSYSSRSYFPEAPRIQLIYRSYD